MANHRSRVAMPTPPPLPPDMPRADRDAHEISMGVTDRGWEVASAPPLQPSPIDGWFAQTWQYLLVTHLIDHSNEIVAFTHSPRSVTVRLSNGQEYCLDKERL